MPAPTYNDLANLSTIELSRTISHLSAVLQNRSRGRRSRRDMNGVALRLNRASDDLRYIALTEHMTLVSEGPLIVR